MAKYYEFPAPVPLQEARRVYLSRLDVSLARPNSGETFSGSMTYIVTDAAGVVLDTIRRPIDKATFDSFLLGLAGMPGVDPEEKLLNATPTLIGFVPAGGVLKVDPDPNTPPV